MDDNESTWAKSDSESSVGDSSADEGPSECLQNSRMNMYWSTLDPKYEVSDHDSDNSELSMNTEYDTEPENLSTNENDRESPNNIQCTCGKCPASASGYCCREIDIACRMLDSEEGITTAPLCITESAKFRNCILNTDVLRLIAFSMDKLKIHDKDVETQRKLFGHTAYRCFLALLELHGLGKGNRYELPSCVVHEIRRAYPSRDEQYTGFKIGECSEHATLKNF